jgi:transposase
MAKDIKCVIKHLTRAGYNQNQIAKRIGVSRQYVHQIVDPRYQYKPKGCKRTRHDRLQVALRMRWQGYTYKSIAEYLDITPATINVWLSRHMPSMDNLVVYYRNRIKEEEKRRCQD